MVKWVSFLGIGAALSLFAGGCAASAGDIASGYGTVGSGWLHRDAQKRLAKMIESGEADRMLAEGKDSKHTYYRGVGDREVMVTEHRIQGLVYRVDVRCHVNPVTDVLTTNVRQVNYGPSDRSLQTVCPLERAQVLQTLAQKSFEAQGQVAYRSYIGSDGEYHPVRLVRGDEPDWTADAGVDLVVRTDTWPQGVMLFRGVRPEGRDCHGLLMEPDGRWVTVTEGSAVPLMTAFYNPALHDLLKCIACKQAYDTNILRVP
jgi:hypothetical protein